MALPSFWGHGASRLSQPKPQRRQDGGKWMAQCRSVRCRSHWSHSWRFTRLGWWQRWWEIPAQGLKMPEILVTSCGCCCFMQHFSDGTGRVASQNYDGWNCEIMKCCRSLTRNRTLWIGPCKVPKNLASASGWKAKCGSGQCDMDCPWEPRGQVELKKSKPAGSQADMQLRLNN